MIGDSGQKWTRVAVLVCAVALGACAAGTAARRPFDGSNAQHVSSRLTLPDALEAQRGELARAIAAAHEIAGQFADANGWRPRIKEGFYDSAEVFPEQAGLWRRVLELNRLPPDTKLPTDGLAAGIEAGVLVVVTPEEYSRLRPEYAATTPDAWTRLVAHEIVHRLHVAILDGNEDAMGPPWFYEGFAVVGAGQLLGRDITFTSPAEALSAVKTTQDRGSYGYYAAAVRYFAGRVPLRDLVEHAGRSDFEPWLLER